MIENKTDLLNLRNVTNAGTSGYCGNTVYYRQTADIDISDQTDWGISSNPAIGIELQPFLSNYDGENHTIELGINISASGTAGEGIGLFGHVGTHTITDKQNVIKNLEIIGSIQESGAIRNIGAFAAFVRGTTEFNNCINRADITNNHSYVGGACGGICASVGYNYSSSLKQAGTVTFVNCKNYGILYVAQVNSNTWNTTNSAFTGIGGICGSLGSASSCTFEGCENHGTLYGGSGTNFYFVGGILGYGRSSATFIGVNINASDGIVKGKTSGGIVGKAPGGIIAEGEARLRNDGKVYGGDNVGGIIGYLLNTNSLTGSLESSSTASVEGSENVGGIIGQIGSDLTSGGFTGTYTNNGSVIGTTKSIGGIIGYCNKSITLSGAFSNSGNVEGVANIGGILGRTISLIFSTSSTATNKGTIKSSGSEQYYTNTSNTTTSRTTSATGGVVGLCTQITNQGSLINGDPTDDTKGEVYSDASKLDVGGIVGCCLRYKSDKNASSYINGNGTFNCESTSSTQNYGHIHSGSHSVGGICGYINQGGTVQLCTNKGEINGSYSVGGIIGNVSASFTIHDCINNGSVTANGAASSNGVAGIVGTSTAGITVYRCVNNNRIEGKNGSTSLYIGGITGYATGVTMYDCGNRGDLEGRGFAMAGLAAACRATSTITNCYNQGNITFSNTTTYGGGITTSFSSTSKPVLKNCYFSGSKIVSSGTLSYYGNMSGTYNASSSYTATCSYCYSLDQSHNGSNYSSANYTISTNASNEYVTSNSDKKLKEALNDWRTGGNASYSEWVSTDDTELPHLAWED